MENYERECLVRDAFAEYIGDIVPGQIVMGKERSFKESNLRVDLQTVDGQDRFREWEFKLYADYKALGQILIYMTQRKQETKFKKDITGVIAAFAFQEELVTCIRTMNLAIELVEIPQWLAQAGNVPLINHEKERKVNFKKYDFQEMTK